ncbi:MAG: ribokinase [Clostridia bacterium]
MKENIITVIGSLNYDIIFKQKRLANLGETLTADSVTFAGGGKGANQAVQCAKLGARTYMVGTVGMDVFGECLFRELGKFNVNTDYIKSVMENTGIGVDNVLEDGTLIGTISTGANFTINKDQIDEADDLISRSKIIIVQMEIPIEVIEYTIDKARKHNCYIILNAAPAKEISDTALSKLDCLVVNEPEATFYSGEKVSDLESAKKNCEKLFEKVKGLVIITLGENGSLLYDGKTKIHVIAKKVNAIDSLGAGDSYIGAFAYKILECCGHVEAAKFAAVAGALTVTRVGAQSSMPTLKEILEFK